MFDQFGFDDIHALRLAVGEWRSIPVSGLPEREMRHRGDVLAQAADGLAVLYLELLCAWETAVEALAGAA